MPLSAGTRLGPYEILAPIGAGGMGEVYRARDTKLDRDVAIKVLPAALAQDAERLARFEREAKVLASLNHPNIAQIYGVEESGDVRALVMELVPGESLKGPLPLETALSYAKQIADALEAAHEKGIVHRDLKPANIMVTPAGVIKVLDFGLASVLNRDREGADPASSPTLTISPTRAGMILGTAAYMSPEQARGKAVDKRADIWAFGAVFFEMLTGRRLFDGETVSDTLAHVLTKEPDWEQVPAKVRRVLEACLQKDPRQRLQAIGDWRLLLTDAQPQVTAPLALNRASRSRLGWIVAGLLALALAGLGGLYWRATRPVDRPLMRLSVDLGPDAVAGRFTTTAISPDGARLVFPIQSADGTEMLAARLLDETKPSALSGTENGRDPFFSPDGKWIGFFADGKLKKVSAQGGAPIVLCEAPDPRGASWGEDGNIVAALDGASALSQIPSEGGAPQPVTKLQGMLTHRWPQVLPAREAVLFTLSSTLVAFEDASIAVASLKTGDIKILVHGGYFGRYLPTGNATGHLVYVHEGVLFAVPFDPARLALGGTAVPILEDLASDPGSGAGQFSFSRTESLVYRSGRVSAKSYPLSWLDNSGKTKVLLATPGFYVAPRFSPDGQRVAVSQILANERRILVYDWQRDATSRLAFDAPLAAYPTWSPDAKHIVIRFSSAGGYTLGWIRADGAGDTQHLLDSKNIVTPYSFFPDGRRLAYYENDPANGIDLWTLPLDVSDPDHPKAGKPEPFLRTPANERNPAVSPDGLWISYASDESGRFEVYVRPFPGPGGKWQISSAGGRLPIWSRKGRELYFQNLDNRIMVADYEAKNGSFDAGKPRLWSDQQVHDISGILNYDLAPDGERFAIFPELKAPAEDKGAVRVTFLLNFLDELRRRAPAGK
jgi:Tol biopolymer transport system component